METTLRKKYDKVFVHFMFNNQEERISLSQMYHFFRELEIMPIFNDLQKHVIVEYKKAHPGEKVNVDVLVGECIGGMLDVLPFEIVDGIYTDEKNNDYDYRCIRLQEGKSLPAALANKVAERNAARAEVKGLVSNFLSF